MSFARWLLELTRIRVELGKRISEWYDFFSPLPYLDMFRDGLQILGITGLIGLTTLVYYVGYTAEGKRPNKSYNERKSESVPALCAFILTFKIMDILRLDNNDEAIIKEVATIE